MSIDELSWKEFNIAGEDGVFKIVSSSSGIDKNKLVDSEKEKHVPYITRTDMNNGVTLFVSKNQRNRFALDSKNVITIGLDTQTVFYQPHYFFTGQNIQVLTHEKLNKYNAFFIIPLIKVQMQKFNWGGNGATLGRLARTKIMLPIDKKGNPYWKFMEEYTKEIGLKKRKEYEEFVYSKLKEFSYVEVPQVNEVQYNEYVIGDLFELNIGASINGNKVDKVGGKVPYITRKEVNNGLDGFIDYDDKFLNNHYPVITVGNETAKAYVQISPFFTGTKVNVLKPKEVLSEKVLFFIASSLNKHKGKYNYSYTLNSTRLREQKILLPCTEAGTPDYQYMEQYISNLMIKKYKFYLNDQGDKRTNQNDIKKSQYQKEKSQ